MFLLAAFAMLAGICLTVAIVIWGSRRLGLPVQETLLFFGLLEQPDPYGSTNPRRIA